MNQHTETQYDDDLTLGTEDYDDSYYTDADDLFEFAADDESPISRLRSLVLSIDWEITDEVLTQFNEELTDLKDIWAGDKVNLVYVQALEKISKYIYQKKADAHPNAIKLLLSLYYNLEKIVSSHELTDSDKHALLVEDVKRFEHLKRIIAKQGIVAGESKSQKKPVKPPAVKEVISEGSSEDLLKLKAIVLGIDWEITDEDLTDLKQEVLRLEKYFSASRPKLILLQGIGTLGAYIKVKKSNAHADAFKVLHLFYESLEKIVTGRLSLEEEKAVLFPAVEKFNEFKALLGPTIAPDAISRQEDDEDMASDDYSDAGMSGSGLSPALADFAEDEVVGFQEEEEAKTLGEEQLVVSKINDFFHDDSLPAEPEPEPEPALATETEPAVPAETAIEAPEAASVDEALAAFDEAFSDEPLSPAEVSPEVALQGVDVEYDDDDEEEEEDLSLRLSDEERQPGVAFPEDDTPAEESTDGPAGVTPAFMDSPTEGSVTEASNNLNIDSAVALKGVAVESEADDDSDLEALPRDEGELAPALLDSEEESIFSAASLDSIDREEVVGSDLSGTLTDFFGEIEEDTEKKALIEEALPDAADDEMSLDEVTDQEEPAATDLSVESEIDTEVAEDIVSFSDDHIAEISADQVNILEDASAENLESDSESLIESELDEQINDFFADDEAPELVQAAPLVPDVEIEGPVETEAEVEAPIDSEVLEEEVVFQLVEEEADSAIADVAAEFSPEVEKVDDIAALETDEALPIDAVPGYSVEEEVVDENVFSTFVAAEDDVSVTEVYADEFAEEVEEPVLQDDLEAVAESTPFNALQECVESIGLELDDRVFAGLFQEINTLRSQASTSIIDKMFLQLLSTVTQHIDSYRYEASADSFSLLKSITASLVSSELKDPAEIQGDLLAQTVKVLQWQQDMLNRQAVAKGDTLTFADPLRQTSGEVLFEGTDAQVEFDNIIENEDVGEEGLLSIGDGDAEENVIGLMDASDETPDAFMEEVATFRDDSPGLDETIIDRDDLKSEIEKLRTTLQQEISLLRKELLNK